ANQSACANVVTQRIKRGHRISGSQYGEFALEAEKEAVSSDKQCLDFPFPQRCKDAINFVIAACGKNNESQTKHACGFLQVFGLRFRVGVVRIYECANDSGVWHKLMQCR